MQGSLEFLPLVLPAVYVLAALWFKASNAETLNKANSPTAPGGGRLFRDVKVFALVPVLFSAILLVAQAGFGPLETPGFALTYLSASLRADLFAASMTGLVSSVGAICMLFSRRYLSGDENQSQFYAFMSLTLASVITLILSNTLTLTVLAWIAMSLSLHRLLVFYPDRPAAQRAASKKYVAARIGDLCLLGAAGLLVADFGTDKIDTILATVKIQESVGLGSIGAALLIVVAAVMKSAQFPFNGWLLEVMETPTPVSALLHAGVVNAGGFLVIRFSDLLLQAPEAMWLLAVVGGVTAIIGSIAMVSQTSIKVGLAWSTVAQMGLMILQCGLGAFSVAALHLIAHSFYKAHAFLSAGSVIDEQKMPLALADERETPPVFYLGIMLAVASLLVAVASFLDIALLQSAGGLLMAGLFTLGTLHMVSAFFTMEKINTSAVGGLCATLIFVGFAYVGLHHLAPAVLGVSDSSGSLTTTAHLLWTSTVLAAFALVMVLQWLPPSMVRPAWLQAFLIHASNGFYANAFLDRFLRHRSAAAATLKTRT